MQGILEPDADNLIAFWQAQSAYKSLDNILLFACAAQIISVNVK